MWTRWRFLKFNSAKSQRREGPRSSFGHFYQWPRSSASDWLFCQKGAGYTSVLPLKCFIQCALSSVRKNSWRKRMDDVTVTGEVISPAAWAAPISLLVSVWWTQPSKQPKCCVGNWYPEAAGTVVLLCSVTAWVWLLFWSKIGTMPPRLQTVTVWRRFSAHNDQTQCRRTFNDDSARDGSFTTDSNPDLITQTNIWKRAELVKVVFS